MTGRLVLKRHSDSFNKDRMCLIRHQIFNLPRLIAYPKAQGSGGARLLAGFTRRPPALALHPEGGLAASSEADLDAILWPSNALTFAKGGVL